MAYGKAEDLYLKGKGSWIKAVTPNQWDKWSMTLHPDTDSLEKVRDLQAEGVKNVIKRDDEGYYLQINRPINKMMKGKVVAFLPPKVVDKDDNPITVPIGNGSDVTVKMEVYQHPTPNGGKAKAMRWVGVRIDNLIPFDKEKDFTDEDKEQISGLSSQPEQLF